MCIGVPGKVVSFNASKAVIKIGNIKRQVFMQLVPEAKVGDYVLVHAGCAIEILDEKEAEETLKLLKELAENEVCR